MVLRALLLVLCAASALAQSPPPLPGPAPPPSPHPMPPPHPLEQHLHTDRVAFHQFMSENNFTGKPFISTLTTGRPHLATRRQMRTAARAFTRFCIGMDNVFPPPRRARLIRLRFGSLCPLRTADNEYRWNLYVNLLSSVRVNSNHTTFITFVMERHTLQMCRLVGGNCFYAESTLSRVSRNHTGADDYKSDFWRTTVLTGKPLALWLSSTMSVDFVFIETARGPVLPRARAPRSCARPAGLHGSARASWRRKDAGADSPPTSVRTAL